MTIKELEKLYPPKKYKWLAVRITDTCVKGYPNWNYNDNDIVVRYEEKKITNSFTYHLCVENKELKTIPTKDKPYNQLKVYWRKK